MDQTIDGANTHIVIAICDAIHKNKDELSRIDGETGDGDHGVNMNKGFMLAKTRISDDVTLSEALDTLGSALVDDIGGSMGPIYGTFFLTLADAFEGVPRVDAETFGKGLGRVVEALMELAGAKPGDKTLIDTLVPAYESFEEARKEGAEFGACLEKMQAGAECGWRGTESMQAKVGRAARLGERSIGHLDAGATSCRIILDAMADEMINDLS